MKSMNWSTENKTLVLEHPRQSDRTLKDLKPWETTENFYRFRITLAPGKETSFPVSEVISRETSFTLNQLNRSQIPVFLQQYTSDTS